jgi:glutamine amidotransferase
MTIAIVDYGAGNLRSVMNVLHYLGESPVLARTPEAIAAADRIILPGVGAAGEAMGKLRERGLDQALDETVRRGGRPLFGICLGMQLLADRLWEYGEHRGLGWVRGDVIHVRDQVRDPDLRTPHMGWNRVEPLPVAQDLFAGINGEREFYFAHSYTLRPWDEAVVAARTTYGAQLVTAVRFETVFATQFHPEKSQVNGEKLIAAFLEWAP